MTKDDVLTRYRHLCAISRRHYSAVLKFLAPSAIPEHARQLGMLQGQTVIVDSNEELTLIYDLAIHTTREGRTYYNIPDPVVIQQRADAQVPLEQVNKEWPIDTDPRVHLAKIQELFDSSVTIVNVHAGQMDQRRVIEFYGREVLPRLDHLSRAAGDVAARQRGG